ncbi:hypothetical protein ml_13 [Mollivirus sibericum]|uniref:hypothetical protein n=1 Tax=Mollivirus sibericum TaxID=1678078 RepID=UPI0006B2E438|nr:hypothetical protein ml_13 [Mollivirus sibericum]ALD61815.1 hypothetical protein ml_13 [Mollivirus sibericum]
MDQRRPRGQAKLLSPPTDLPYRGPSDQRQISEGNETDKAKPSPSLTCQPNLDMEAQMDGWTRKGQAKKLMSSSLLSPTAPLGHGPPPPPPNLEMEWDGQMDEDRDKAKPRRCRPRRRCLQPSAPLGHGPPPNPGRDEWTDGAVDIIGSKQPPAPFRWPPPPPNLEMEWEGRMEQRRPSQAEKMLPPPTDLPTVDRWTSTKSWHGMKQTRPSRRRL